MESQKKLLIKFPNHKDEERKHYQLILQEEKMDAIANEKEEYNELQKQLNDTYLFTLSEQDDYFQKINRQLETEFIKQDESLQSKIWKNKYHVTDEELQKVKMQSNKLDAVLFNTQQTLAKTKLQNEKRAIEIKTLSTERSELNSMKDTSQRNATNLQKQLDKSQMSLEHHVNIIKQLTNDLKSQTDKSTKYEQVLKEYTNKLRMTKIEKDKLNKRVQNLEITSQEFKQQVASLDKVANNYKDKFENVQTKMDKSLNTQSECKLGLKSSRYDLEHEKNNYLSLRKKYEEQNNQYKSMSEALEKFKKENTNLNEVVEFVNLKYQKERKVSEKLISGIKEALDQRNLIANNLKDEQRARDKLEISRDQMEHKLQLAKDNGIQSTRLLGDCESKSEQVVSMVNSQKIHISNLEEQIEKLSSQLQNKQKVEDELKTLTINKHQVHDLKLKFKSMAKQNDDLKEHIRSFEKQMEDNSKLKTHHKHSLALIVELKSQIDSFTKQEHEFRASLKNKQQKVEEHENYLEIYASRIKKLTHDHNLLIDKLDHCIYPGEKERLDSQIMSTMKDRDDFKKKFNKVSREHALTIQENKGIKRNLEDLLIVKEKYEMDIKSMESMNEKTSFISAELIQSKKKIRHKDEQLELLATQLASVVDRLKKVREREENIKQKFVNYVEPEAHAELNNHLIACKQHGHNTQIKFENLQKLTKVLKEEGMLNEEKVRSLVDVIKQSEYTKDRLSKEMETRKALEVELKSCAMNEKVSGSALHTRIKELEQQYTVNLKHHDYVLTESKTRVRNLQEQLEKVLTSEHQARERLKSFELSSAKAVINDEKKKTFDNQQQKEILQQVNEDLRILSTAINNPKISSKDIDSLQLKTKSDIAKLNDQYESELLKKEKDIQDARIKPYSKIVDVLQTSAESEQLLHQQNKSVNQDIRDILKRHNDMEQTLAKDTLSLRIKNRDAATKYKMTREAQRLLLSKAHENEKKRLSLLATDPNTSSKQMQTAATDYNNIILKQINFESDSRTNATNALRNQKQYIEDLNYRVLPELNKVSRSIEQTKFPIDPRFVNKIDREQSFTINAIRDQSKNYQRRKRAVAVYDTRIKALISETKQTTDNINALLEQPSPQIRKQFVKDVNKTREKQIQLAKAKADLEQDSGGLVGRVFVNEIGNVNAPGYGMMGPRPNGNPNGGYVYNPDQGTFTSGKRVTDVEGSGINAVARSRNALKIGRDVIYLVLSHTSNKKDQNRSAENIKLGLKKIVPCLLSPSTMTITYRMVKIGNDNSSDHRIDILNPNKSLSNNCNFESCQATETSITNVETAENILLEKLGSVIEDGKKESVVVVTFKATNSDRSIRYFHLVDVVVSRSFEPTQTIFYNSWVSYLAPTFNKHNNQFSAYIVFHPITDPEEEAKNNKMINTATIANQFITQYRAIVLDQK